MRRCGQSARGNAPLRRDSSVRGGRRDNGGAGGLRRPATTTTATTTLLVFDSATETAASPAGHRVPRTAPDGPRARRAAR